MPYLWFSMVVTSKGKTKLWKKILVVCGALLGLSCVALVVIYMILAESMSSTIYRAYLDIDRATLMTPAETFQLDSRKEDTGNPYESYPLTAPLEIVGGPEELDIRFMGVPPYPALRISTMSRSFIEARNPGHDTTGPT